MPKQRRAQSRARNVDDADPAKIEAAIKNELERLIDRALRETDIDAQRVVLREQNEFVQALRRLRQEVVNNHRGWTWNLLAVLDWDEHDLRHNELLDQGSTESLATTDARRREEDRAWRERGIRLHSALDSFLAAQGDLTWAANATQAATRGAPGTQAAQDSADLCALIRIGGNALHLAVEEYDCRDVASRTVSTPRRRQRLHHVRESALRILAEVYGYVDQGRVSRVELANFVNNENDRRHPPPCGTFADGDGAYANIRKIFSRRRCDS